MRWRFLSGEWSAPRATRGYPSAAPRTAGYRAFLDILAATVEVLGLDAFHSFYFFYMLVLNAVFLLYAWENFILSVTFYGGT